MTEYTGNSCSGRARVLCGGSIYDSNIYGGPFDDEDSPHLVSGLRNGQNPDAKQRRIQQYKNKYQTGRKENTRLESANSVPNRYAPPCSVKDPRIRTRLATIARRFQYLDRWFAQYFQATIMPSFDQEYMCIELEAARSVIAKSQSNGVPGDMVELGDLGDFCESVIDEPGDEVNVRSYADHQTPTIIITKVTPDDLLRYLQDAREVPYWRLMLSFFLQERKNQPNLNSNFILQALNSTKISIEAWKRKVLNDPNYPDEEIRPIMDGITTRLEVLDSAWDQDLNEDLLFDMMNEQQTAQAQVPGTAYEQPATGDKKTVLTMSLMILGLIGSIVPFAQGFATSKQSTETGSTSDADFWYLVTSSVVAVLGSLVMVTDLMADSWNSPAYNWMWLFTGLGVVCAVLSIAIYPLCNTGWSSMLSYIGSIMSMGAVLVMTQATTRPPTVVATEAKKKQ